MSRPGLFVVGALLAGLAAAIAIVARAPEAAKPTSMVPDDPPAMVASDDLSRCRILTEADAGCAAAWDAKRRHFFGEKD